MALIGSRMSFDEDVVRRPFRCGECRELVSVGTTCLVSRRNGKVAKRVCSHTCREAFDDRYWQERADEKES